MMKIIGLTGLTGAGKSTVAQKLMAYGCYHIDADKVAREVINNNENVKNKLKERFGADVINADGTTNRPLLASRAFADEQSTLDLNAITHPAVIEEIKSIIKDIEEVGYRGIIIDAIALFESGLDTLCDFNVTVVAPKEIRLERIMKRDNITEEKALERINAQKDESFFTSKADFVLWNYPPYDINVEIKPITLQLGI
ncbi:MAG: dephospho-CoA kinase [Clostridia bacterium]|nr:dephospho-CoA kinase [Clostridia bacterium]